MSAYRFCRTDDIGLLVDALNRCWPPHAPGEPLMTPAAFKRSIRDLQIWCSSCMVAFSGSEPIGVLIGAKRPSGTLIHRIAVHPDHLRQGHGRHLLTSLSSKLSILGPPRIIAEVPETFAAAVALFDACGYVQESILTDYVLDGPALSERSNATRVEGPALSERSNAGRVEGPALSERSNAGRVEGFVIPVSVDDLAANGLLEGNHPQTCWERTVETLTARKGDIEGLGVASDERIEAYILYTREGEILSLRTLVEDNGLRLSLLLAQLRAGGLGALRIPKVHPAEISKELLETLGFRPAGGHRLYAATARSE
jgi:GNAT superfamily N-acetyltransferase